MNAVDSIDISSMSTSEKLGLMEKIWRELLKDPEKIEVPQWHLEKLSDAENKVADGSDEFVDIDAFEAELRQKIDKRRSK